MADEDSQQKIEKKKTDKNVCCHFCRISQNRNRRILGYAICNGCRKSYCRRCLEKYLDEDFETLAADESKAWQCLCCKLQCCCCFQLCTKDHRHCFTYRRTQQRHISVAPKWTKRKKGEEAKDDDDEPSPQRAKRKYTQRKQDEPLKNKRLNVNTNGEEMEDYNPSDDSGEGVTSDDDSVNEEEEEATGNLLGFVGSFKKEKSGQIRLDALPQNVTAEELKLLTEQAALQDEKDGESPTSKKKKDSKKEPRKGRKGKKDEEGTFPFPHGFPPPLLPFGAPYNPMGLMRPFDSRMAPPLIMPIPPLPPYPMPPQGYYPLAMHPGPSAQQQQLLFMQQQQQQQMMMNHFPPGFNPQAPFLFPPPALQTGFPYPGPLPGGKAPAQEGIEGAASDLANIGAEQQPQEEPAYAEVKEDASNGMHEEKPADSGGVVEAEITTGLAITTSEAANGTSSNNDFNAYPASATTNNNTSENKIF